MTGMILQTLNVVVHRLHWVKLRTTFFYCRSKKEMTDKTDQACIATSFFLAKTNAKGQIADTYQIIVICHTITMKYEPSI